MKPERFEKLRKHAEKQDYGKPLAALTLAGYLKECLDEIERLQAERRWIPVTERLPTKDDVGQYGNVLWCSDDYVETGTWRKGRSTISAYTHWMPLPDGPEKGEG